MLNKLPEKQRKALVLRDLEDVPYEKMAEVMMCTEQAARLKVFSSQNRLRDMMLKAIGAKIEIRDSRFEIENLECRISNQESGREDSSLISPARSSTLMRQLPRALGLLHRKDGEFHQFRHLLNRRKEGLLRDSWKHRAKYKLHGSISRR